MFAETRKDPSGAKRKKLFLPYAEFAGEVQPDTQKYLVYLVYTGLFLLATLLLMANAQAQTVQVLHWWTSTSEEKAIASLSGRMAQENIVWKML